MFDGSTTSYEGLKRTDTVNIFPVTIEGKIMLGKQEQPGVKTFIAPIISSGASLEVNTVTKNSIVNFAEITFLRILR